MMDEHVDSGEGLRTVREITYGYEVPEDACNTYRAMLTAASELSTYLEDHGHVPFASSST
jgi:regulator of cell morphogenesis and NO signaling